MGRYLDLLQDDDAQIRDRDISDKSDESQRGVVSEPQPPATGHLSSLSSLLSRPGILPSADPARAPETPAPAADGLTDEEEELAADLAGRHDTCDIPGAPSDQVSHASHVSTPAEVEKPARTRSSRARFVHRIWAIRFPDDPDQEAEKLAAEARRHGAVLVADGPVLIVSEDPDRVLPAELFGRIARHAGAIIAILHGEHRRRPVGVRGS